MQTISVSILRINVKYQNCSFCLVLMLHKDVERVVTDICIYENWFRYFSARALILMHW